MRSVWKVVGAAILALSLGGCMDLAMGVSQSLPDNHVMQAKFDPKEAAHIHQVGNASISGVFTVPDRYDGSQSVLPGAEVRLYPDTAFMRERVEALFGSGKASWTPVNIVADDARYKRFSRIAHADDAGQFKIENVPAGTYYLIGYGVFKDAARVQESALVYDRIVLAADQHLSVTLDGR